MTNSTTADPPKRGPGRPRSTTPKVKKPVGRPPGSRNKVQPGDVRALGEMARAYTPKLLKALFDVATNSPVHAARVSAANALLDRGYGRPSQSVEIGGKDGAPIEVRSLDGYSDEELELMRGIALRQAAASAEGE